MTVTVISQASAPALSLADARVSSRRNGTDSDGEIMIRVAALTAEGEHITGRVIIDRTYRVTLDSFPGSIDAPASPAREVAAINYVAADGIERTLNPNQYRLSGSQVVPVSAWPETAGAVMVDIVCGYGPDDTTTPPAFKGWLMAKVQEYFAPAGTPESPHLIRLLDSLKEY